MKNLILLSALSLLSSCGYHLESEMPVRPLSVPFAVGDHQGELTNQVIYQINTAGKFRTTTAPSRYTLKLELVGNKEKNIGFRYDRNEDGQLNSTIIPSETRTSVLCLCELWDTQRCCVVLGPAKISASYAFDHEWYSSWGAVNVFSLGQVTDYQDAKDQVHTPLYRNLATKISDWLMQF